MAFNKYQWGLYLKAGGDRTVRRFHDFLSGTLDDYPDLVRELVGKFCPDEEIVCEQYKIALEAVDSIRQVNASQPETVDDDPVQETDDQPIDAHGFVAEVLEELQLDPSRFVTTYYEYVDCINLWSHCWAYRDPSVFFPYLFGQCFIVLTSIAEMFGIELPPIPGKTQYKKRLLYYADLCDTFKAFSGDNGLSAEEMFAFLYEYAPACVGGTGWVIDELPDPRNIFVFGYGSGYPEKDASRKWICQGSPDMQPGDIGLLYHWAPDSCYTSIWRAVSPGFYDPLGYHDRYVCYGDPVIIPRITFSDLKADPIFKKTALVRTNMLRMDGAPMLPSEYMHLLEMARAKGEVPNTVPLFELRGEIEHGELLTERDVEVQLLEPLLLRLDWKPEDWCRQMPVRVGRGTSKYPDYVIHPVFTKYNERGDIVLEAKLTIPGRKQLERDRGQANSYAKLLGAHAYVLVAREGIWIAEREDDFSAIKGYTWKDLEEEDNFSRIYSIIGNRKKNTQKKKRRVP